MTEEKLPDNFLIGDDTPLETLKSDTSASNDGISDNESLVEMEDVWRVYKTGSQEVQALRGVNLNLKRGEFVALMGRSGSGKTTLLNCLGGLDRPTSGVSRIFGQDLSGLNDRELTKWRRERVGFIFQSFGLLPTLSAYENVELMLRIAGERSGKKRRERAEYCLDLVGLKKWMGHRPYELSGGQQQRVAIARSLANNPKLILADEPTGELDTNTAREILSFFKDLVAEEKTTLLMVTHDNLGIEYVDYVLRLKDGQIVEDEANGSSSPSMTNNQPASDDPITRVLPTVEPIKATPTPSTSQAKSVTQTLPAQEKPIAASPTQKNPTPAQQLPKTAPKRPSLPSEGKYNSGTIPGNLAKNPPTPPRSTDGRTPPDKETK